jgi:hypothetical protein
MEMKSKSAKGEGGFANKDVDKGKIGKCLESRVWLSMNIV